jgi:type IX secretion system PorP/SprF family membrane protein
MKKIILSAGVLLIGGFANAQSDVHYSQFYSLPTAINPATAGIFEGSVRASFDYRTQWAAVTTPWTTMAFASDFKFGEDDQTGNFFNGGVMVYNDKAGDSQFKTGLYNISFGYTIHVSRDAYFTTAIQGGLIQNSIDYSALNWESQYNGYEFDQSWATNENQKGQFSQNRGDISLGIYYFNAIDDKKTIFMGASGGHLLGHNVSMMGVKDNIFRKYTVHGGAQFIIERFGLIPNFVATMQGPNMIINVGSDYKIWFNDQSHFTGFIDEISMGFGTYYRFGDAFMFAAKFNYAGFTLSGNYDFNLSQFSKATLGRGGLEMLLTYRHAFGVGKGSQTKFL